MLVSTIKKFISVPPFACLVGIPIGITTSAIGVKICAVILGMKSTSQ